MMKLVGIIAVCITLIASFVYFNTRAWDITNLPPMNEGIVAYGDSLVEGVGAETEGGFVTMLSARLGKDIVNLGTGGMTTSDGLRNLPDVMEYNAGIVIVVLGGNDALRRISIDETRSNLDSIVRSLTEAGSVVVLGGVRGGLLGDPYDKVYEAVARSHGALLVPNILEDIILDPAYTIDQLHPNDLGHQIVADRFYTALRPIVN